MNLRMIAVTAVVVVGASSVLVSCGAARKSGLCEAAPLPTVKAGNPSAVDAAATAAWKNRKDEAQLKEAIKQLRDLVAMSPRDTKNYVRLAKALYLWADGYLRFQDGKEAQMLNAFEEATFIAERALRVQNPDFQFQTCSGGSVRAVVSTIRKQDIPAIYWYAAALGKYGLAKSIVLVLENKDRIKAFMKAIRKMDPAYNHWGSDRYLGAFFTKIPFPKGDLKRSKKHFKRSIKKAPNYLATRVLMAKMLATKLKDRALFKEQLDYVLKAPVDIVPNMVAEHIIEKKKAKQLLEDIDVYFPPAD